MAQWGREISVQHLLAIRLHANKVCRTECEDGMTACGRYCCKSRKLQGYEFFAKTRNGKQSPIRITSIALPRSPVSLSVRRRGPHILTRKPHLQPAKFSITSAKRLLQHNRPQMRHSIWYYQNTGTAWSIHLSVQLHMLEHAPNDRLSRVREVQQINCNPRARPPLR